MIGVMTKQQCLLKQANYSQTCKTPSISYVVFQNSYLVSLLNILSILRKLDAQSTEARTRAILLGLGFKQNKLDVKFNTLSGGWRSRCSLAAALLQQPDLVIKKNPFKLHEFL